MENQQNDADLDNSENALPLVGEQSILDLLTSDDTVLANALRRLQQAPEYFAAFNSALPD